MSQPTPPPDGELDQLLSDPEARRWFEDHLADLRQDAYGQRIQYQVLVATFAIGLVAYVIGYLLRSATTTEPVGLLVDMVYTLGFALWTAAIVVVVVEIVPEAKRRQIRRSLEAYEAIRRTKAKRDSDVIEQM
jgi:F0F1-type ATP synthase assembly protein I